MIRKLLFLLLLATPFIGQAQDNFCGTVQTESDLTWLRDWQANYTGTSTRGSDVIYVPLKVHIVGNDDGGGYLALDALFEDICILNEQFAETGFYFYIYDGIHYINNSGYYNHDFFTGAFLFAENNVSNLVNMYFVGDPAGNCGYYSPSGNAIAVANACADPGNTTIAHELGHFFSLPHTFYGWEWGTPSLSDQEQVDGDNCNTAADGFCDTPPDYIADRWNCPGPTLTDPDGVEFMVDGSLFMCYANDACANRFSPDQQAAMIDNINGPRAGLLSWGPITPTLVDTTTLLSPEDLADNQYSNYTQLEWSAVEDAVGYEVSVSLTTTFTAIVFNTFTTDTTVLLTDLTAEKTYRWRVRPLGEGNTCIGIPSYQTFSTGSETIFVAAAEDLAQQTWSLTPNPVHAGQELELKGLQTNGSTVVVRMFDITGSAVWSETYAATDKIRLELPEVQAGIYLIQWEMDGNFASSKIVVQ